MGIRGLAVASIVDLTVLLPVLSTFALTADIVLFSSSQPGPTLYAADDANYGLLHLASLLGSPV
jgi:hypothetical protein